jgi:phosphoglycolate phosphatase
MPVKLLIFDLDGTLVDSSTDISNALNHAIQPYGVQPITREETVTLVGEGVTKLIGKVIQLKDGDLQEDRLLESFLEHYTLHLADNTAPYDGVREGLRELRNYAKAVLSNKNEKLTVNLLRSLDLLQYFDYVAGGDTVAEKKPSPAPVLSILDRFDIRPDEALLVGDSIYDIEAGRNAGLRTVAALYGYGAPGFAQHANFVIHTFSELPGLIAGLS